MVKTEFRILLKIAKSSFIFIFGYLFVFVVFNIYLFEKNKLSDMKLLFFKLIVSKFFTI